MIILMSDITVIHVIYMIILMRDITVIHVIYMIILMSGYNCDSYDLYDYPDERIYKQRLFFAYISAHQDNHINHMNHSPNHLFLQKKVFCPVIYQQHCLIR